MCVRARRQAVQRVPGHDLRSGHPRVQEVGANHRLHIARYAGSPSSEVRVPVDPQTAEPTPPAGSSVAVAAPHVAVVEAGGVQAADAVLAATAAHVRFDDHPVADLKLIHRAPQGDHVARVLVAEDELAVRGICGMPWWMIFRSVPQTPHALTRTRTSSSPGAGTGRCWSSNRWGAPSTVAVMVAGIGMVTPFACHEAGGVVGISDARRCGPGTP